MVSLEVTKRLKNATGDHYPKFQVNRRDRKRAFLRETSLKPEWSI